MDCRACGTLIDRSPRVEIAGRWLRPAGWRPAWAVVPQSFFSFLIPVVQFLDDRLDGQFLDRKVAEAGGVADEADERGEVGDGGVAFEFHVGGGEAIEQRHAGGEGQFAAGVVAEAGGGARGGDDFFRSEVAAECGDLVVENDCAVVDHDDAAGEPFNVVEVVGGQNEGDAFAVHFVDELADLVLGDYVEADGGFVQEDDFRVVEHGHDELAFHALAEGEVAGGLHHLFADGEHIGEAVHGAAEVALRDAVDGLVHHEGVYRRNVPHELGLLAEHGADLRNVFLAVFPGAYAEDGDVARGGVEYAGEDLERGRFSRAVRSEKADELSLVY